MSLFQINTKDKRKGILHEMEFIDTKQDLIREIRLFGVVVYRKVVSFDMEVDEKERKRAGFK